MITNCSDLNLRRWLHLPYFGADESASKSYKSPLCFFDAVTQLRWIELLGSRSSQARHA